MIGILDLLKEGRKNACSDIHLSETLPPVFRKNGKLYQSHFEQDPQMIKTLIFSLLNEEQWQKLEAGTDVDFCYTALDGLRQRVNVYQQQGSYAAAIRLLHDQIPTLDALSLSPVLKILSAEARGLLLITGPTGSGKSTTLAAMVDEINTHRPVHILTIEDPIEYQHTHKAGIVHQREIGRDATTFASALRSALREDPDVILVGEMRDYETVSAAITAAETGHLVLSTLHTSGATNTINRIIDVFPSHRQQQIRTQLSDILKGVITQQLVPLADGSGRIAAQEILTGTNAVRSLIREDKTHQLTSMMQTGEQDGMKTLNADLARLVREKKITKDMGLKYASDKQEYDQYLEK